MQAYLLISWNSYLYHGPIYIFIYLQFYDGTSRLLCKLITVINTIDNSYCIINNNMYIPSRKKIVELLELTILLKKKLNH